MKGRGDKAADRKAFRRVLFVCQGNTCRSPFAMGLAKKLWAGGGIEVRSAGLAATPGAASGELAIKTARKFDVDLSAHQAKNLDQKLVLWADLIYVMEPGQKQRLESAFSQAAGKTGNLADFLPEADSVFDPMDLNTPGSYQRAFELIANALSALQAETAENDTLPLVLDLDGTLINGDTSFITLTGYLKKNPLGVFMVLFWHLTGRAHVKARLAAKAPPDYQALNYNRELITWAKAQGGQGRRLILATGADRAVARGVADHLGMIDDILASDGKTNLTGAAKLAALTRLFGKRGFDYAGNSSQDLAVWRGANLAILVNAAKALKERVKAEGISHRVFEAGKLISR